MCEFCSKTFFKPGELKVHLGIHHGINSFKCRFCDESFKYGLITFFFIVYNIKYFFSRRSKVLKTHLEKVHNKRKTSKEERLSKYFTEFSLKE